MICWKLENSKNCPNNLQSSKVPAFHASPLIFMRMKQKHFVNFYSYNLPRTPPIVKIICVKYARAKVFCGIFFIKKKYAENMKKIIGAVRELPAKYHPPILGGNGRDWLWYLDWQISPKSSHDLFHVFSVIPEKTFARFPARKVMQYSMCVCT